MSRGPDCKGRVGQSRRICERRALPGQSMCERCQNGGPLILFGGNRDKSLDLGNVGDPCLIAGCANAILHPVFGLCKSCYVKRHKASRPPSVCHPDRPEYARGACRRCYSDGIKYRAATCHPEFRMVAKGLCRKCYGELPEVKHQANVKRRARKYGLSRERFLALLGECGGVCPICGAGDASHVDHDHATGAVRGLLCHRCNVGLGFFQDDKSNLASAIAYLTKAGT